MDFDVNSPAPHNWSAFRKNIGRALLYKNGNSHYTNVWDMRFTNAKTVTKYSDRRDIKLEKRIESEITRMIQENFSFRILKVDSQEQRIRLESRLIATLAQCNSCNPSHGWLGIKSPINAIRTSGLWQTQHLDSHTMTESEKEIMI